MRVTPPATLPLTVIGGFLGAGKTSLVNHLLRKATHRIAVLVNDFGAVNIDAELIGGGSENSQGAGSLALTDGCACCALGDDLALALQMLRARTPAPDAVIIEASGIADPWRIAQVAMEEPGFALEPLVVVVDAAALPRQLADPATAGSIRMQLGFAELVVLNKADDPADAAAAAALVTAIRPEARQVATRNGAVDPAVLEFPPPPRRRASRLRADDGHGFRAVHWRCPGPLDPARLRTALAALPRSVLRVKGFFAMGPEAAPHLLQYAAERWAVTPSAAADDPGFVVIGTPAMPHVGSLFAGAAL